MPGPGEATAGLAGGSPASRAWPPSTTTWRTQAARCAPFRAHPRQWPASAQAPAVQRWLKATQAWSRPRGWADFRRDLQTSLVRRTCGRLRVLLQLWTPASRWGLLLVLRAEPGGVGRWRRPSATSGGLPCPGAGPAALHGGAQGSLRDAIVRRRLHVGKNPRALRRDPAGIHGGFRERALRCRGVLGRDGLGVGPSDPRVAATAGTFQQRDRGGILARCARQRGPRREYHLLEPSGLDGRASVAQPVPPVAADAGPRRPPAVASRLPVPLSGRSALLLYGKPRHCPVGPSHGPTPVARGAAVLAPPPGVHAGRRRHRDGRFHAPGPVEPRIGRGER